jgi:hypothetical protein
MLVTLVKIEMSKLSHLVSVNVIKGFLQPDQSWTETKTFNIRTIIWIPRGLAALWDLNRGGGGISNPISWRFVFLIEGLQYWLIKLGALSSVSFRAVRIHGWFCLQILGKMSANKFTLFCWMTAYLSLSLKGRIAIILFVSSFVISHVLLH